MLDELYQLIDEEISQQFNVPISKARDYRFCAILFLIVLLCYLYPPIGLILLFIACISALSNPLRDIEDIKEAVEDIRDDLKERD